MLTQWPFTFLRRILCTRPTLLHGVTALFALIMLLGMPTVLRGCHQHRATAADCNAILTRIVQIELREQGFRDPALVDRKRAELQQRFATDLAACEGRPITADAMSCVQQAKSAEEISHTCLR